MLSQTSEHALRAVLYLAQRASGEERVSAEVIADALGAPRNYLSKTLHALAREGVVSSTRGPNGGFRLETAPERLTLAEVVRPFDEPRTNRVCLLGGRPCGDDAPCDAHFRWKAVSEAVWAPLRRTTVAELLERPDDEQVFAGTLAGIPSRSAAAAGATERTGS